MDNDKADDDEDGPDDRELHDNQDYVEFREPHGVRMRMIESFMLMMILASSMTTRMVVR